jgi:penicillin amidase
MYKTFTRKSFDPSDARRYMTPTGWREAEVRTEIIKVRQGLTTTTTDNVMHEVTVTRHGPIIIERGGTRYALRWTALDPDMVRFDPFYRINRARNWKEFTAGLRDFTGPAQNFVFADAGGDIGYYAAGRIPFDGRVTEAYLTTAQRTRANGRDLYHLMNFRMF